MNPEAGQDALTLRKRFVVRAGVALALVFLLALGGSLNNYVDAVAPAEREPAIGAIYNTIGPALNIVHRYGGYLLLVLLPACGLPLLRLRKIIPAREGKVIGMLGMVILALGSAVSAGALFTGRHATSARRVSEAALEADQTLEPNPGMEWHLSWVPLALACVTLLILLAALRVGRAVPKPGAKDAFPSPAA